MWTGPRSWSKRTINFLSGRVNNRLRIVTAAQPGSASVAVYESMQETLDILSDDEALADLRLQRLR